MRQACHRSLVLQEKVQRVAGLCCVAVLTDHLNRSRCDTVLLELLSSVGSGVHITLKHRHYHHGLEHRRALPLKAAGVPDSVLAAALAPMNGAWVCWWWDGA